MISGQHPFDPAKPLPDKIKNLIDKLKPNIAKEVPVVSTELLIAQGKICQHDMAYVARSAAASKRISKLNEQMKKVGQEEAALLQAEVDKIRDLVRKTNGSPERAAGAATAS